MSALSEVEKMRDYKQMVVDNLEHIGHVNSTAYQSLISVVVGLNMAISLIKGEEL